MVFPISSRRPKTHRTTEASGDNGDIAIPDHNLPEEQPSREVNKEDATMRAVVAWRVEGDERAAQWLVGAYRPLVRSIVHWLPSQSQAEDAEQETLVRAFAALDRYDVAQPFGRWIGTIARNVLLNTYRSHRRHERQLDRSASDASLKVATRCRPDYSLMAKESLSAVFAHLERCDARASHVFRLHAFSDLSAEVIADLVGASPGAIRVSVHRTRNALRQQMEAA